MFNFLKYIRLLSTRNQSIIVYLSILLLFIVSIYYGISYLLFDTYLDSISFDSLVYFLLFMFLIFVLLVLIFFFSKYLSDELFRLRSFVDSRYRDLVEISGGNNTSIHADSTDSVFSKLEFIDNNLKSQIKEARILSKSLLNLYDLSPSMLCVINIDGVILDVNNSFLSLLGVTKADVVDRSFFNFLSNSMKYNFKNGLEKLSLDSSDLSLSSALGENNAYLDLDINGLSVSVLATWNKYPENAFSFGDKRSPYGDDGEVYLVSMSLLDIRYLRTLFREEEGKSKLLHKSIETINKLLAESLDSETLFSSVLEELFELLSYDLGIVLFSSTYDEGLSLKDYNAVASVGLNCIDICLKKDFDLSHNSTLANVIESGKGGIFREFILGELIDNDSLDDDFKSLISLKTSLVVPLILSGVPAGLIIIDTISEQGFSDTDVFILEAFAGVLASGVKDILLGDEVRSKNIVMKSAMKEIKKKDILFKKEIELAVSIQKGILPLESYEWNGIRIESYYEAMSEIGGDFFDYFHLPQGELMVFIADVSGHGIPAALITIMVKISVTSIAQRNYTLKSILSELNLDICKHVQTDDYISGFFLLIDKNYDISYINAGHQLALLFRRSSGKVISLDTAGYFCGISEELSKFYDEKRINFSYGDRIILYTDGITEVMDRNKEQYGVDRLKSMLIDGADLSVKDLKSRIISDVKEFSADSLLSDDLSLIVLELDKEYEKVIDATTKGRERFSLGKYKESIIFFKRAMEFDPSNLDIMLMLGEAFLRTFNFEDSIKYFRDYVHVKKDNIYAYYRLSLGLFKLKDYDGTIEICERALEIDKEFTKSLYLIGLTYKKLHNYDKARFYFERLLSIEPSNKKAILELRQ